MALTKLNARSATALDATILTGNLPAISGASLTGISAGISAAAQWRLTTSFTGDASPIASNWEVSDTIGYGGIGTPVSESSGIFSFSSTGIFLIHYQALLQTNGGAVNRCAFNIATTVNDSAYTEVSETQIFGATSSAANGYLSSSNQIMFDVTDTSTHKVQFRVQQEDNSNQTKGSSSQHVTGITFLRLGDT